MAGAVDSRRRGWIVAVVVLVLVAAGLWLGRSLAERHRETGPESGPESGSQAGLETAAEPSHRRLRPRSEPASETDPPSAVEANARHRPRPAQVLPDGDSHGALEGRVVDWATRQGVAGAELSFVIATEAGPGAVAHETVTGPDGRFRFAAPLPGTWTLATLSATDYLPYAPPLGVGSVSFVAEAGRRIVHADLYLHPATRYRGRVVDGEQAPVAGATIELLEADAGERSLIGLESSFRSDGEGRFEFRAPELAVLEARHPDHEPGRAQVGPSTQLGGELVIVMGTAPAVGDAITGRVIDQDAQPMAAVEVVAEPLPARLGEAGLALARAPRVSSEADGSFRLAPLDARRYAVTARIPGRATVVVEADPGDAVELRVDPGLTLRGRLEDETGSPVAAGSVAVLRVTGPLARKPVAGRSVFAASGEFAFRGLEAGRYDLVVLAPGYARAAVTVDLPQADVAVVRLDPGASLYGRVVAADDGRPLPLARIEAGGIAGLATSLATVLPGTRSTVSDADGAFELSGVAAGRHSLSVAALGYDGKVVSGIEVAAGERSGPITVELNPVAVGERPKTEIAGIGVAIGPVEGALTINAVIADGGAERAGLREGDVIVAVEGEAVVELGFETAVQNIRGQVGSYVELELRRADTSRSEIISVERRRIEAPG